MSQVPYAIPTNTYTAQPYQQGFQRQAFPSRYLTCYLEEDKILMGDGTRQQIGVTVKAHEDLQKEHDDLRTITQQYHDRLVELGEIVIQPTQEEIIRQQAEQLQKATALLTEQQKTQETMSAQQALMIEQLSRLQEQLNAGDSHGHASNLEDSSAHTPAPLEQVGREPGSSAQGSQRLPAKPGGAKKSSRR